MPCRSGNSYPLNGRGVLSLILTDSATTSVRLLAATNSYVKKASMATALAVQ